MKDPPTVLPELVAPIQASDPARTGTHFVTGDRLDTPSAPAAATLDVSFSSPPPYVSKADVEVLNPSTAAPVASFTAAPVAPVALFTAAPVAPVTMFTAAPVAPVALFTAATVAPPSTEATEALIAQSEATLASSPSTTTAEDPTPTIAVPTATASAMVAASARTVATALPWMPPGPSRQSDRSQTYREFAAETANCLAAVFQSLLDESDAEAPTPSPPSPLAEGLPEPTPNEALNSAEAPDPSRLTANPVPRSHSSGISRSRSKAPPGGLSGLVFSVAIHRMLKHLALTQLHVGTEWLTLLQIFTENGGNGSSRFHDVHNLTIIKDYAIVRPERQPDIWFSLRDNRSLRALTYFVRLSTQYAWWTCKFIDVLQTPTPSAAIAISRILKRLRPSLRGITFPQSPDFWFGRRTHDIRRSFTWLPIDQASRKYVRGVYCYANHLIEPDYWTQSHLVRVHTEGCSSCCYTQPGANDYLTAFAFYRDLPPYPYITDEAEPPNTPELQYLAEATDDDYILQASITWPSSFFFFWQDFGTHFTVLHMCLIARCHLVPPREFILQLIPRIRDSGPRLRHVQIEFSHTGEAHAGDSVSVPNQATEFAFEIYVRCQEIRLALEEEVPPLPSTFSVTAEYDCWHASATELQQAAANMRRILEGPERQVALERRSDTSYVVSTTFTGPNYQLTLRITVQALTVGRSLRKPPANSEAERVQALRSRLQKNREQSQYNA